MKRLAEGRPRGKPGRPHLLDEDDIEKLQNKIVVRDLQQHSFEGQELKETLAEAARESATRRGHNPNSVAFKSNRTIAKYVAKLRLRRTKKYDWQNMRRWLVGSVLHGVVTHIKNRLGGTQEMRFRWRRSGWRRLV